jgi:hypothetical protein
MLRFLNAGRTESHSRRRLRDLVILLIRCAVIVLIAMLFARPMLATRQKPGQARSIYCLGLDNSMSMAYRDGVESYLEKMKESAAGYIRSAESDALFNICSLASGDWSEGLSREQALAEVKALKTEPDSTNISDFVTSVNRVSRTQHEDDEVSVFVVSDFTPVTMRQLVESDKRAVVEKADYELICSEGPVNNAALTDARVIGITDGKLTVNVTAANYGQAKQRCRLTARAGENESAVKDMNLSAQQRRTMHVQLRVGSTEPERAYIPLELSLSGGDGLKEDDTYYVGVCRGGHKKVNVVLAGDGREEMFLIKTAMDTISRKSSYYMLQTRETSINDFSVSDLQWADVVVCSAVTGQLAYFASDIEDFIEAGGRFICFVKNIAAGDGASQLWRQGVLAALPGKCVQGRAYMQPSQCEVGAFGVDNIAARSLSNYRVDRILLKGYMECQGHPKSRCLWRLQNGEGFVYLKRGGIGVSILVNTSVDDTLGTLTKSNASVAFCQYLLGKENKIGEYSFARGEQIMLPLSEGEGLFRGRRQVWVQSCDGVKRRAVATDSYLLVPEAGGTGWVKTLSKPTMWAGVNLPEGETDMAKPTASELADVMKRVFPAGAETEVSAAEVLEDKKLTPIWEFFVWAIILLLLVEPAVANRLKR